MYATVFMTLSLILCALFVRPAAADEARTVELFVNAEVELCDTVLKQAQELYLAEGNFCAFPVAAKGSKLQPVRWKPASLSDTSPLLGKRLPLFGWDTRGSWSALGPEFANRPFELVVAEYWRRYGDAMIEPIRSGQGSLEMASIDVDNDGDIETVYRVTTLRPTTKGAPQGGFMPLRCSLSGQRPERPYYSLFFDETDQAAMGRLGYFDKSENVNLATYDGATIRILMSPDSISVSRIKTRDNRAWYSQKCALAVK